MFKQRGDLAPILRSLSKRGWRWLISFMLVGLVAILWLVNNLNQYFSVTVATAGGSLTEGIIGSPRFINPLLAVSDSDRDLTTLIYSGLMRINEQGEPTPDLAERVEVSADGLTYTFHLRNQLTWHDGAPLTTDDVEFTIASVQDLNLKSPKRAKWLDIKVEKVDDRTINFHLKQPYPSFLENATMGILPKHIWSQLDSEMFALNQFNTESVGSGPYRIKDIKKDRVGIPEYYDLVPFEHFALGAPKITDFRLRFYPSELELLGAYQRGEIEAASGISASSAKTLSTLGTRVLSEPLPRVFGVFFNQNRATVFANQEVRRALDLVIDREAIIKEALKGYGLPITGPLAESAATTTQLSLDERYDSAKKLLENRGWILNAESKLWEKKTKKDTIILQFTLTTSDTPELKRVAELTREAWIKLGAKVELKVYEIGDLNQNVIRPRQYEALLFGEILGRNPDTYAFWHSSQRLDPGLNIALYTNSRADKALEAMRHATSSEEIAGLEANFVTEITNDTPAVFIYAPEFIYILPEKVSAAILPTINTAADRFLNIHHWYIKTNRVWPIFSNNQNKIK